MTSLTVAVLYYNKPELTIRCLSHLVTQINDETELLLVDNGSEFKNRVFPHVNVCKVRVVRLEKNKGNIGGINACFSFAQSEIVLFVSNDAMLGEGCVRALFQAMKHPCNPGQIQPLIWKENLNLDNAGLDYRWPGYGIALLRKVKNMMMPVDIIPSIVFIMKKGLWEITGGFDEALPSAYEDVDMSLTLKENNVGRYVATNANAVHLGNATLRDLPNVRERFHQARLQVINKHFAGPDRLARLTAVHLLDRINNTWNSLHK